MSYFVYGEKINVYSGTDPVQKEFMDASVDFIGSAFTMVVALPLYRIYPNKTFRDFRRIVRRIQRVGEFR